MKVIRVTSKRCVGCRMCEQWCSYSHHGVVSPALSRIRVLRDLEGEMDIPLVCHQCANPLCIKACPASALSRNTDTGAVVVSHEACVGCGLCVEACPHGAIGVDSEGCPVICDLCGGKPQCMTHCPEGVIRYQRRELADRDFKKIAAQRQGGACE
jgi:Fe-S-cluster-containing hydrogenase component 2